MHHPSRFLTSLRRLPVGRSASSPGPSLAGGFAGAVKWLFGQLPADFPEFIYTVLLRPWPLRQITNFVIRKSLPRSVQFGMAVVMLNPADPVVSGALALRVYENAEREFMLRHCEPGMTFLDVGANIGYYTALAAHQVGPAGQVLSLEPDPQSFGYLLSTVAANAARNVRCFQLAATDAPGLRRLYLSQDNRGDNRIYQPEADWESVEISAVTVDGLLKDLGVVSVDFIKIDVQGAEGTVLAGMQQTVRNSGPLTIMTEFWPEGLAQSGTDPMEFLVRLEEWGLDLYELPKGAQTPRKVQDKVALIQGVPGRKYTTVIARKAERVTPLAVSQDVPDLVTVSD